MCGFRLYVFSRFELWLAKKQTRRHFNGPPITRSSIWYCHITFGLCDVIVWCEFSMAWEHIAKSHPYQWIGQIHAISPDVTRWLLKDPGLHWHEDKTWSSRNDGSGYPKPGLKPDYFRHPRPRLSKTRTRSTPTISNLIHHYRLVGRIKWLTNFEIVKTDLK